MARLESIAKAGFYPTPERVVAAIAKHVVGSPPEGKRVIRLLDPCCGEGAALSQLASSLGAESYGIEINTTRAESARGVVEHVLNADAASVRLSNGGFSYLFLNPPYDYDDEAKRLEHAFLTRTTRVLPPGGVLAFLIPQKRLAVSGKYLASQYDDFALYRFPDPEYKAFKQMVLFARRKPRPFLAPSIEKALTDYAAGDLTPLPDAPEEPLFRAPRLTPGAVIFASIFFDRQEAAREAQIRGVWTRPEFTERIWPPSEKPVRPLMPLRNGHLALLIAAGMLNNVLLEQDGTRALVKGRTYKEFANVPQTEEGVAVQREMVRTSVSLLDLDTGRVEQITQKADDGEPDVEPTRRAA